MLVTVMMWPCPARRMEGTSARVTRHTPKKFTSIIRRIVSSDVCSSVPR